MQIPDNLPYRQGVNGIVMNKVGEYLVLQKSSYNDGQWDFPGGGIEEDETPEDALLRELQEELTSSSFDIRYRVSFKLEYDYPIQIIQDHVKQGKKLHKGQQKFLYIVLFTGDKSEINPADGTKKVEWVSYKNLKDYLVFENQWNGYNRAIIEYRNQENISV